MLLTLAAPWHDVDGLDAVLQPHVLAELPREVEAQCADFPSLLSATATTDVFLPTFIDAMTGQTGSKPWTCLLRRSSVATRTLREQLR